MNFPKNIQNYIGQKSYAKDNIGMSGAGVYLFDNMVLKIQEISTESENEITMLKWLNGKIPAPNIIEHICENEYSYILMDKCQGKMACDPYYMERPKLQMELLGQALQMLWSVDISDCPKKWPLERRLKEAENNIVCGRVDMDNVQPDTFGPGGFKNPDELLYWLRENQPEQIETLCHGDFCLPNILLSDNTVTGMIDLGRSGVADPWQDIALCYRSLSDNYSGVYNGKYYEGLNINLLFDILGIRPDWERIQYYILLDELF